MLTSTPQLYFMMHIIHGFQNALKSLPTWVRTVHVDEFGPPIVVDDAHQSVLQLRPQLDDELVGRLNGEGRGDEADV